MEFQYIIIWTMCLHTILSSAQDSCRDDWVSFQDYCYYISGMQNVLPFKDAQQWCEGREANLTSIHSQEEQDFHLTLLNTTNVLESWIGLNDATNKGDYRWTDGTVLDFDGRGPPDSDEAIGSDCIFFDTSSLWDSSDCYISQSFICKRPKDIGCEVGWAIKNREHVDEPGLTMVSPDQMLTCSGQVTEWRYLGKTPQSFRAIVWRPISGSKRQFQIVGINEIPAGDVNTTVTYIIPENERITVKAGDVIGWSFENPNAVLAFSLGGGTRLRWLDYNILGVNQVHDFNAKVEKREYSIAATVGERVTTSTTEEIVKPRTTTSAPTDANSTTEELVKPRTTTSAPTALDEELGKLADVNVTTDNVLTVAKNLTVLAESNVKIDDDNLEDISNILDDIVAVKDPSLNVTESVVNTVDNIIESYVGETRAENEITSIPAAPNQIQRTLEQQISTLHTNPDIVNTTIQARNVAIQAVKVPKESVVNRRLVFETIPEGQNGILNTTVTTRDAGEESEDEVEAAISFQLPIDIFSNITGNQALPVSFFVYNDATLFPSTVLANKSFEDQNDVQRIVASRVISATLEGVEVKNLPEQNPVETLFALNKVNKSEGDLDESNAIECVFWDITASNGLGDWSNDGCQYNRTLSDGRVVCHCNHLTSFAVLVDIHGQISPVVLDILSKVGCGISIICLLITLVTYLSTRRLRRVMPKQILISFCFSLLCLYVVFVIGIERGTKPDAGCIMVSALLHYFTLTSIAWMAVEAFHMYCLFVKVVGRWAHISRFLLKASIVAWGLPAVMVIIVLIADVNQYNNEKHCFLKIGNVFYFTHLLVLALVVGVNTVIFGLVMHRLTCGRNTTSSSLTKQEERREALKRAQNAIAISILMGLTWVFGLFSLIHEDSSFVFQALFCICNSFQGAFIFVMFCVRQPDVVAIWKERISFCKTNESKGHKKVEVSQTSGLSDIGQKTTVSSDVATAKL